MTIPRAERGTIKHALQAIGQSRSGAPLEAALPVAPQPRILLLAGQHGDEPESTALLSHALRRVEPGELQSAAVLALNPDGLCRGTRGNAAGVDLNRNFPTADWTTSPVYYRWAENEPRDVQLSAGQHAASEPETRALLALLARLKPQTVISIHAPLACIDDPAASALGRLLAKRTGLPLVPDCGYPTPGSLGTWALENGVHLITWELPHASLNELRQRYEPLIEELLLNKFDA